MFGRKKERIRFYGKQLGGSEEYEHGSVMPIQDAVKLVISEMNNNEELDEALERVSNSHLQNGWLLGMAIALDYKVSPIILAFLKGTTFLHNVDRNDDDLEYLTDDTMKELIAPGDASVKIEKARSMFLAEIGAYRRRHGLSEEPQP